MVVESASLQSHLENHQCDLITGEPAAAIRRIVDAEHTFLDRSAAEVSPQWRQIIPYAVITHGGSYYLIRRLSKQREARLHDRLSIGLGGHINPGQNIESGLERELREEVSIPGKLAPRFIGVINDEMTEVGRVHLGMAFFVESETADVAVLETEKMTGSWATASELEASLPAMESWSAILVSQWIRVQRDEAASPVPPRQQPKP